MPLQQVNLSCKYCYDKPNTSNCEYEFRYTMKYSGGDWHTVRVEVPKPKVTPKDLYSEVLIGG